MQECRRTLLIIFNTLFFQGSNPYANAHQYYVIRTLPMLFGFLIVELYGIIMFNYRLKERDT